MQIFSTLSLQSTKIIKVEASALKERFCNSFACILRSKVTKYNIVHSLYLKKKRLFGQLFNVLSLVRLWILENARIQCNHRNTAVPFRFDTFPRRAIFSLARGKTAHFIFVFPIVSSLQRRPAMPALMHFHSCIRD